MKNTEKMISEFLEQIEKDKVLAAEKLNAMEEQRCVLDRERSEISKAVIRCEVAEDREAVKKLNKELLVRVNEIATLDSKIEAYKEMGTTYEAEAMRVFEVATKEYVEEHPKELDKVRNEVTSARKALEDASKLAETKQKELTAAEQKLSGTKAYAKYIIDNRLKEVLKYASSEIQALEAPEPKSHYEQVTEPVVLTGITVTHNGNVKEVEAPRTVMNVKEVLVEDNINYGYGMDGKLNYYYHEVMKGAVVDKEKKKSLVDKILGR